MITTINEWRKYNEGFGSRIAIADIEEDVQQKIKHAIYAKFASKLFGDNAAIKEADMEIGTIYYEIPSLKVETDYSTETLAKQLNITPEELALAISDILKTLPKNDLGMYDESKNNKSKLSKAVRKFISDKIEFLISKEGKPRKQAIAIAYSYAKQEGLIK